MSIEAQRNIDMMCQDGTPQIDESEKNLDRNLANYRSQSMFGSRAQSIVFTRDNFVDMPTISKCLPDVKSMCSEPSQILSEAKMHVLRYHLPGTSRLSQWQLLFKISRDGNSHLTFYQKVDENPETVLAIRDKRGYVFGAFMTEQWRMGPNFYGDGYSFTNSIKSIESLHGYSLFIRVHFQRW